MGEFGSRFEQGAGEHERSNETAPWQMTLDAFIEEYERVMSAVALKERNGHLDPAVPGYQPVTKAEQALLDQGEWKEFSRQRGFSEADIIEYEHWLKLSGQADGLEGAFNDPWRRSLGNWAKSLWRMHIERAIQSGQDVPDAVLTQYQSNKFPTHGNPNIRTQAAPIPEPLPDGKANDVW